MLNRSYVFPSVLLIATVFGGSAAIAQTEFGPPGYGGHYAGRIVRAVYGAQGKYADVTGIVRRFARDGFPFESPIRLSASIRTMVGINTFVLSLCVPTECRSR
jgi:hypothetical protein